MPSSSSSMRAKRGVEMPYLARKGYKVISHLQTPDLQALIGSTTPFPDLGNWEGPRAAGSEGGDILDEADVIGIAADGISSNSEEVRGHSAHSHGSRNRTLTLDLWGEAESEKGQRVEGKRAAPYPSMRGPAVERRWDCDTTGESRRGSAGGRKVGAHGERES
jgi:hypothetical protein